MKASLEMRIEQKNLEQSALDASNLSELYLALGEVASAEKYGAESVNFADRSEDGFQMEANRTTHAVALHQAGKDQAAENLFREAEAMQKKRQPETPYLYGLAGFRFCDLLLSTGNYVAVLEQARTTIKWVNHLLSIALEKLTTGKALLLQSLDTHSSDPATALSAGFVEAAEYLNQAVDGVREAGHQQYLPPGLFSRATLFRHQQAFPKAWADLTEAHEIAHTGRCGCTLSTTT